MASTLIDFVDKIPLGSWIPLGAATKTWLNELKNDADKDNTRRRSSLYSEASDGDYEEEVTTHRLGANPSPPAPLRYAPPPPYEAQDAFYPQERRLPSRVYQHPSVSTESFSASSTSSASSNYDDQEISAASLVTPRRPSGLNPSPSSSTSSKSSSRISYFRWSSSSAPSTAPSSPTAPVMPVAEPVMIESPPRRSGKDRAKTDSSTSSTVSTTSPTGTISRRNIEQAVTLASVAAEEDENGNHQVALDLYLTGLEKMLNALPVDADENVRRALQAKLAQFVDRNGLDLKEGTRDGLFGNFEMKAGSISEMMINAAVMSAIALKQSPIPDAISATLCYTFQTLQRVDAAYNVRGKAWELTALGVTRALELDAEYNLHGRVSDAIYTSCAAFIKAGVAYTDAPGYKEVIAGRVNGEEKARLMNGKGRAAYLRQDQNRRASVL
ncbi:hypothetical protein BC937DRAFT_93998 [Endogone sp. FLAS-F59071]|nr:hypothetical protein BC937DRAFT_93998 [Endogone sp. FLAS-F59071]|eukprot:RUS14326.1 hypothetical protein BC937DRAFT_93998 [Endogone sp. FLAS-F59071]